MNIGVLVAALVIFLVIVLLLVSVLLYVKAKFTPQGNVTITINENKILPVSPGTSLLGTLGDNKIFLPSACGGGGTCGLCKCRVLSGGGEILPTETGFLTRKQQQEKWRLGCQVKVREDMRLHIPEEILGIKKWACEVISNRNVATFIKEFVMKLPAGETLNFRSGGYIQIDVPKCEVDFRDIQVAPEFQADWDNMKLWDLKMKNPEPTFRAYSMANYPAEGNIIMLNIRIATPPWDKAKGAFANINPGICSSYLYACKPGDKLSIAGPYGEFFLRDTANEMIFVGGGAGMAPMRSHIFHLFRTLKTKRKVSFWYGARSRREIFYEDEFRAIEKEFPNFKFTIALSEPKPEDNWTGATGFIHQALYDLYLKNNDAPEDIEYYLCGPPMMTDAVTSLLDNLGVPAEMIMFDNFGS
ncbi:MAG: NADH:ubiquinone reductase (Na(+)-transporting) subunit F [Prevotellaceae bacterium]|jgi:Na+-transporting NADH:ubiquinone oxidoreductase subunit F|nr:NADH:ubiquinone reductase (Na(+)-transporting) subunit F [Prevotellaceae bacterium]